jgi:serine/threonine protein kinase
VECCQFSESAVFDHYLDASEGGENAEMQLHLEKCSICREMVSRFKAMEKAIVQRAEPIASDGAEKPPFLLSQIGGYEVLNQIGEGGMGSVWKARRICDGKSVALKVLFKRLTADLQFIQRFFLEASIGVKLNHANLVKCIEAGEADGCYFMAQEFVDGQDLSAILAQRKSFPEAQALAIIAAAARGMAHAHALGLIHRDIKPANLMLTPDGGVKVMDFGLARCDSESELRLTSTGALLGTPHYISPEQIECKVPIDARADIYSLGATLFHMLTGRPPFLGQNIYDVLTAHVNTCVPDPRTINPAIGAETAKLVLWMCARDRKQRVPSMKRLIQAIAGVMGLPSGQDAPDISSNDLEMLFEEPSPALKPETAHVEDLTLQQSGDAPQVLDAKPPVLRIMEMAMRAAGFVAASGLILCVLWLAYRFIGPQH